MIESDQNLDHLRTNECGKKKQSGRRRSSFFQRRLSTYSPGFSEYTTSTEEQKSDDQEEKELALNQYVKKLKKEKEDWKRLYENLKRENSQFKEKVSQIVDHSSGRDLLTAEDKRFLEDRPDYVRIGRLLDRTAEQLALKQRHITTTSNKLYNLTQEFSRTVSDITNKIISQTMNEFNEFEFCCDEVVQ